MKRGFVVAMTLGLVGIWVLCYVALQTSEAPNAWWHFGLCATIGEWFEKRLVLYVCLLFLRNSNVVLLRCYNGILYCKLHFCVVAEEKLTRCRIICIFLFEELLLPLPLVQERTLSLECP